MACEKCGGVGYLPTEDDNIVRQCLCGYARQLRDHLGPEIASAPLISTSPLYKKGVDKTGENLFIKGVWENLISHLKWALGCKGPGFRFRVVTDEKLRSVYLGQESYTRRSVEERDQRETYNSLADLIGTDQDLVIIRLGYLGYRNVAMPGILKETLLLRESLAKPTWIVEVPSSPFGEGHYSYSHDVASYIGRHYTTINLIPNSYVKIAPHGVIGADRQALHGAVQALEDAPGLSLVEVDPTFTTSVIPLPKSHFAELPKGKDRTKKKKDLSP